MLLGIIQVSFIKKIIKKTLPLLRPNRQNSASQLLVTHYHSSNLKKTGKLEFSFRFQAVLVCFDAVLARCAADGDTPNERQAATPPDAHCRRTTVAAVPSARTRSPRAARAALHRRTRASASHGREPQPTAAAPPQPTLDPQRRRRDATTAQGTWRLLRLGDLRERART